MKILQERQVHEEVEYRRVFTVKGRGFGWAFPCTEDGEILPTSNAHRNNLRTALSGKTPEGETVIDNGLEKSVRSWVEPAIGQCNCGGEVELGHFTCTCEKCGADYNWAGQRLAPREQWGEETGEHPSDIGRIR